MNFLANRVRFATATTGTGAITPGAAFYASQTPSGASVPTGSTIGYTIEDGANYEVGVGTWTGTTLTRDKIEASSSSGAAITLSGTATVFLTITAGQLAPVNTNAGRNYIHNSRMRVGQRGTGPFTAAGAYTVDRWQMSFVNGSVSVTQSTYSDAQRTSIGDESAIVCLVAAVVGTSGAGDLALMAQKLEDVRRTAGRTMTLSFLAHALSGTPKLGAGFTQTFGTGGSPSSNVSVNGQAVTLSTTPQRFSQTFALPSASGKTFGTNGGTDYLQFSFYMSSGTTNATAAGNPGVQSNTFTISDVQFEEGPIASPLERPDLAGDLAKCQRFYQDVTGGVYMQISSAGAQMICFTPVGVPMRAIPTVTQTAQVAVNVGAPNSLSIQGAATDMSILDARTTTAAAATEWISTYHLTADL